MMIQVVVDEVLELNADDKHYKLMILLMKMSTMLKMRMLCDVSVNEVAGNNVDRECWCRSGCSCQR